MGKNKNEEKKQVRFVRIRGRVVPIAIGAGAIGVGAAIGSKKVSQAYEKKLNKYTENVGAGKNKQRRLGFFDGQNKIRKENKFYNRVLTKALNSQTGATFSGGGDGAFNPLEKRHGEIPTKSYKEVRKTYMRIAPREGRSFAMIYTGRSGVDNIHTNIKNTPVMLHELGHYIQAKKGTKTYNFFKKVQDIGNHARNKDFNTVQIGKSPKWKDYTYFRGNKKLDIIKRSARARISYYGKRAKYKSIDKSLNQIRKFGRFGIEMDANIQAIKMAKAIRGPKFAKITAKAMIPNMLGYGKSGILKTGKYGLISAGIASIGYGLLKKDRKK